MKQGFFSNIPSQQFIRQMETIAKATSQYSELLKPYNSIIPKQLELAKSIPATAEISRLTQAASKYSNLQKLTSVKLSDFINFSKSLPEIYRVFDNSIFLNSSITIAAGKLAAYYSTISHLQNLKLNFPSILANQHEGFLTIPYLTNRQKKSLLKTEQEQSNNLQLGTDDIDNADCINTNIQTSIALVDQISNNSNPNMVSASVFFNQEYELKELLCQLNPSFYNKLLGAKQAKQSNNVEKARHISISLRELVKSVINTVIPVTDVQNYYSTALSGKLSLNQKLDYFFNGIPSSNMREFVKSDALLIEKTINIFNDVIHNNLELNNEYFLSCLISNTESFLMLLLNYNLQRNPKEPPHA
jgi:hypothetical protein